MARVFVGHDWAEAHHDVFVEDDWQYCELYDYQRAIEGKTWEQLDRLFLI